MYHQNNTENYRKQNTNIIPQDTGHFTRLRASRERYYEASAERSIPRQLGKPQVRTNH